MQTKALQVQDIDAAGKGKALLAVLSDIDNEGDTYAKGAFSWKDGGGQWALMIPAHNKQAMPFGKGWVYEQNGQALADFTLNLNTQAGKDWHEALKFDLETGRPVQEWSYGYRTLDSAKELRANRQVRVLKQLDVYEFSPVLRGMGSRTGTIAVKSAELKEAAFAPLIGNLAELASAIGEDPSCLSAVGLKQLGEIHAALGDALMQVKSGADNGDETKAVNEAVAGYLQAMSRGRLQARI
ncbi:HK97 family phage prohead protease [Novosphingobium huizhouense]|uniref:HK97 family phage prohead protease n=1 Tax=Novosphingobium huizhouense TaxID=2866625 RepID=UPI001CD8BFF2|nr:HK97 family phage prohead protease [Novosphingobium huizhouense]